MQRTTIALALILACLPAMAAQIEWDQSDAPGPARWFVLEDRCLSDTCAWQLVRTYTPEQAGCLLTGTLRPRLHCATGMLPNRQRWYRILACNDAGCSPTAEVRLECICLPDAPETGGCPEWIWPAPLTCEATP